MNFNTYSPQIVIAAGAIILVVILIVAWAIHRQRSRRRTAALRERFGPEYDAALVRYRSRNRAENLLEARLRHAKQIQIRQLTATERSRFIADWDTIQARFVDHPRGAVTESDELINAILQARGYDGGTFEQRADDLSVYSAKLVDPYRRANAITARAGKNEATTEELRTAMILYRALFDELVQSRTITMPSRADAA
ncbi:MAG TPA: hypothetical protein VGJ21_24875 [Terracidiphilus sp.]|jgi:hypothetical protein